MNSFYSYAINASLKFLRVQWQENILSSHELVSSFLLFYGDKCETSFTFFALSARKLTAKYNA